MSQASSAERDFKPTAKLLSFKADAGLVADITRLARENDRSVSAEIRQAVREYVEEQAGQA